MRSVVHNALSQLTEKNRLVATLHYLDGSSYADIAHFLGVPVSTVEGRMHRAKKQLKRRLVKMVEDTLGSEKLSDEFTRRVLDEAVKKAREAQASKIARINLVVGELSSIVDDCVQFYFDFLSNDSIAEGAALSFRRIPMQVRCRNCGLSFSPDKSSWSCPHCGKWDVEVIAGREFYIDSIEVE